jgi:hypothetical protein
LVRNSLLKEALMITTLSPYPIEMARSYRADEIKAAEDYHRVRQGQRNRIFRWRAAKNSSPTAAAATQPVRPLGTSA